MTKRPEVPANTVVHIYSRGSRKMPIVSSDDDRWMFLDALFRANRSGDGRSVPGALFRPSSRSVTTETLVDILAFCVLGNHYHLVLRADDFKKVSKLMQRLGTSLTAQWQHLGKETGRLFESVYRMKVARNADQARIMFAYVTGLNAAEAAGTDRDTATPDEIIAAAASYPFSSFPDYYLGRRLPIIQESSKTFFLADFPTPKELRDFISLRPRRR